MHEFLRTCMGVCASCMCARVSLLDWANRILARCVTIHFGMVTYTIMYISIIINLTEREKDTECSNIQSYEVNKRSGSVHQL